MRRLLLTLLALLALTAAVSAKSFELCAFKDDQFDISYPQLMDGSAASEAINRQIEREVDAFVAEVHRHLATANDSLKLPCWFAANVTCDGDNYFSVQLVSFVRYAKAPYGAFYDRGRTYGKRTGRRYELAAFGAFTAEGVYRQLREQYAAILHPSLTHLASLPAEFYLDDKERVHLIFQYGEVATRAVGFVDLLVAP